MTEERMRIATAEICGWEFAPGYPENHAKNVTLKVGWDFISSVVPNYPNSLDAMAGARRILNHKQQTFFAGHLREILGFHQHTYFDLIDAPARKQCEAFLRTFGKWEE